MELKQLTGEQIAQLEAPLPQEAVKPHPSKSYLSTIKGIFVTERLNQVFGLGKWYTETKVLSQGEKQGRGFTATVDCTMYIPEYGFQFQSFGGSDNDDLGDALKGANTDATTKIAAVHLHVGLSVYKGEGNAPTGHTAPVFKKRQADTSGDIWSDGYENAISMSGGTRVRSKEVTPPMVSTNEVKEPSKDELNDIFENAVVPHEEPLTQHREKCKKCPGMMDYIEGIGKQSGKPFKMWKCASCADAQFIKTK